MHFATSLQRHDRRLLVRFLSGHVSLNWHLTRQKVRADLLCQSWTEEKKLYCHFFGRWCATMLVRNQ